jgi:uridine kinase
MKDEIMKTIHDNRVVLIRGNTGCGKTTQVTSLVFGLWSLFVWILSAEQEKLETYCS